MTHAAGAVAVLRMAQLLASSGRQHSCWEAEIDVPAQHAMARRFGEAFVPNTAGTRFTL